MYPFSPPSTANSPPPPHSQLLKQRGKQWSRAEQWLPQWCTGVVYLFEAWACPTRFPSNPPTVTDGASVPRLGLHYSVTSLCQRHSLTTRRDMKNGREAQNIFMHACTCTCVPHSEEQTGVKFLVRMVKCGHVWVLPLTCIHYCTHTLNGIMKIFGHREWVKFHYRFFFSFFHLAVFSFLLLLQLDWKIHLWKHPPAEKTWDAFMFLSEQKCIFSRRHSQSDGNMAEFNMFVVYMLVLNREHWSGCQFALLTSW